MRRKRFAVPCLAAAAISVCCICQVAAQAQSSETEDSPERLVQAAMESEIGGSTAIRKSLLAQALAIDPDFAPARWQSGFVRWRGQWHSPGDVAERASADRSLTEYRRLRDPMIDTADNQRVLAEWCRKHRLIDEARTHWLKVLEFEPGNASAHEALGLEWFDGRLLTRPQIVQAKKEAKARQQAIRHFSPMLAKWRSALQSGSARQRDEARDGLRGLTDTAAVPAIGMSLEPNVASTSGFEFQLLLVETLGRMQDAEATSLLVRMALQPESIDLRAASADQLKKRPMFAYVPQLIAAAPPTVKNRFEVLTRDDGQIVCRELIVLSGRNFDYTISRSVAGRPIASTPAGTGLVPGAQQLTANVVSTELDGDRESLLARVYQVQRDEAKQRIQFALERTTGFTDLEDPRLWEKQWNDFNGWQQSEFSMEPRAIFNEESLQSEMSSTTPTLVQRNSCFPAGTPVLSLTGPVAIETLRSGDRVLAQDLRTGELTYKTVHETTLRPATPLVSLSFGSETIRATPGHPFWVVGAGWRVAKFLKPGDRVHGMYGATVVDAVEPVRPSEVYNLVVSDLHNYFVGQQCLLVHDNSALEETAVRIPGLAAKVVAP